MFHCTRKQYRLLALATVLVSAVIIQSCKKDPPPVVFDENGLLLQWAKYTGKFRTKCNLSYSYGGKTYGVDTTYDLEITLTSTPGKLNLTPFYSAAGNFLAYGPTPFNADKNGIADLQGYYTCRFSPDSFYFSGYCLGFNTQGSYNGVRIK
jgi:hypothetical protein